MYYVEIKLKATTAYKVDKFEAWRARCQVLWIATMTLKLTTSPLPAVQYRRAQSAVRELKCRQQLEYSIVTRIVLSAQIL
jgi:hypothetical protein